KGFHAGWFYTGAVVTADEEGTIKIVDSTSNLIKSAGEWISSVELENIIMAHESVFEAPVIAVPHEKWTERPVACVVLHDEDIGQTTKEDIMAYLKPQFAKYWLPDEIHFVEEIPKTTVGKFLTRELTKSVLEMAE